METNEFVKSLQNVNLDTIGGVGDLYELILSVDFKRLTIDDFTDWFPTDEKRLLNIIGLWAFELARKPKFNNSKLIGYNQTLLNKQQEELIIQGLITILKTCRIEDQNDGDAVDIQFDACGRLYRVKKNETENLLMNELQKSQNTLESIRLIDALGLLVGFQNQGYLKESTVDYIKDIAVKSNNVDLRDYAKSMLINDVARRNKESPFLQKPLNL